MLSVMSVIIRRIAVSAIIRRRITGSAIMRMCRSIICCMCACDREDVSPVCPCAA
jgi:hypothetical protein